MATAPGLRDCVVAPTRHADPQGLLARYAAERRPTDREALVRRFRPLARGLARRYARDGEPADDLEQVAMIGLLKAIDRFEPDRGFAFTSFAVPTILGELKRSVRDTAWAAHVPRGMQERVITVCRAADDFVGRCGRAPRARELADLLQCDEESVVEALHAAGARSAVSLDAPRDQAETDSVAVGDVIGHDEPGYELVDDLAAIERALPTLTDAQRTAIKLRFEEDLKQTEIARRMGISQMHVSRLLRSGLERLIKVTNHQSASTTA
jgi:RNA polymerase sigma-B factor